MRALEKWVGRAVLLLAVGAFILSFEKLYHVALASGIHPRLAWIYPALIEGFTTICTLAAFLKHGRRGAWYPWIVGLMAFGYSLWANSFPEDVPAYVVRGVPVVCIPLMVHMWIIIKGLRPESAAELVTEPQGHHQEIGLQFFDNIADPFAPVVIPATPVEVPEVQAEPEPEAPRRPSIDPERAAMVDNFLEMAENAKTPERQKFWETKATALAVAA